MIQSGIFDSFNMEIKKIANTALVFTIKRLIEMHGLIISVLGILLLISLITYSPNDPNFIFPENTKINNLLGFHGSYISDLFFQSIGLISYLIPITLFFTGINIFRNKDFFLIIENIFFSVLYAIAGAFYFSFFYKNTFTLFINGNGGFVGNYINQTSLNKLVLMNENIAFYFLILLVISLFLLSINFSLKKSFQLIKNIINIFKKKTNKNYTDKSEIINEYIPQDEIKNVIQEDLPFIKADTIKNDNNIKFKLPSLDLLKTPTKKERGNIDRNEKQNPEFLEKILLDFGVK